MIKEKLSFIQIEYQFNISLEVAERQSLLLVKE
nr:MAG TPA: hypothetical protein [Caudoviricetes sp.]